MLTELLLLAGAGLLGKKAIENPEKTKEIIGKLGDSMADQCLKSDNPDCQKAGLDYYDAKMRREAKHMNDINDDDDY